jgi:hypothetical protein
MAVEVVFDANRMVRDKLLSWPSQVAPMIAAELDVSGERVQASLDEHVYTLLAEIAGPDEAAQQAAGEMTARSKSVATSSSA